MEGHQRVRCKADRDGTIGALWMLGGLNGSGGVGKTISGPDGHDIGREESRGGLGDGSCQGRTEHGMMGLGSQ